MCVWLYGLFTDVPGDYVKKPMRDCTGKEICEEWLYHLGVPGGAIEGAGRAFREHGALHDALTSRPSSCPAPMATVRSSCLRAP